MSKTSNQLTVGGFPSGTKCDWQLIVLLGLLINIILIYLKLTPQLTDIELFDESGHVYGGKELASGWRHLSFLLYSPRWLFLNPGLLLMTIGFLVGVWLCLALELHL